LTGIKNGSSCAARTVCVIDEQNSTVAVRWSGSGTNVERFLKIGPTNRATEITGIEIIQIAQGQVVRRWGEWGRGACLLKGDTVLLEIRGRFSRVPGEAHGTILCLYVDPASLRVASRLIPLPRTSANARSWESSSA
jgi:hypothetical protein